MKNAPSRYHHKCNKSALIDAVNAAFSAYPRRPGKASLTISCKGLFTPVGGAKGLKLRSVLPPFRRWLWLIAVAAAAASCGACAALAQELPREASAPFADIDWSVGLRGSYSSNTLTGGAAEAVVAPSVTLTRRGERTQTTLTSSGAFALDGTGAVRVDELRAGGKSSYDFDEWTKLSGSFDLSQTQLRPSDSSLPANTAIPPIDLTASASVSVRRRLAQFDLTARLRGERFIEGPTTLTDSSTIDNSSQSSSLGEAGFRLGYELTPLVSLFVDGSGSYEAFDAASPSLGKYLNGRTTQLRGGLSYALAGTLTAEVSAGRAWYDYTDPSISDAPGWVYGASVTFTPDETLTLGGALDSSIGPSSNAPGETDVDYKLTASSGYQVNPWLKLRGTASYDRTLAVGSGNVASGYSLGAGLDLMTTRHTVWTADYLFAHDQPASDPASDKHTVTVGVTFKR